MQIKTSTLSFFPTLVWLFELPAEQAAAMNASMQGALTELSSGLADYTGGYARQTDTDLHLLPAFQPLTQIALKAGREIVTFLKLEDRKLAVTGCWANFAKPGASHHVHTHPNNFLSAVYYVNTPKGANTINFLDPRDQAHVIAPPVAQRSAHTASQVTVEVTPGRLVMFPAWLRHSVDVNTSDEVRISIAINLMFEQFGLELTKPRFRGNIDSPGAGRPTGNGGPAG